MFVSYTINKHQSKGLVTMETAKLFLNGKSQAVRLPKEYRFNGSEVNIKKIGEVVLLYPTGGSWERFLKTEPLSDDVGTAILEARENEHPDNPRISL